MLTTSKHDLFRAETPLTSNTSYTAEEQQTVFVLLHQPNQQMSSIVGVHRSRDSAERKLRRIADERYWYRFHQTAPIEAIELVTETYIYEQRLRD